MGLRKRRLKESPVCSLNGVSCRKHQSSGVRRHALNGAPWPVSTVACSMRDGLHMFCDLTRLRYVLEHPAIAQSVLRWRSFRWQADFVTEIRTNSTWHAETWTVRKISTEFCVGSWKVRSCCIMQPVTPAICPNCTLWRAEASRVAAWHAPPMLLQYTCSPGFQS